MALRYRPTRWLTACASPILAAAITAFASQPPVREFSADIVSRDAHGAAPRTVARLFAVHGKVRIEPSDMPTDFFLVDPAAPSTLLIRSGRQQYMNARQSSPLTQLFIPIDAADPCPQWRTAMQDAGAGKGAEHWRCEKLETLAFRVLASDGATDNRHIDPKLQFPSKIVAADGSSLSLENVRLGPQPPVLFTVPRDYRPFDPRAVVERIKQSDVWAAPPTP